MATTTTTTTPSYGLSDATRRAVREAGPRPGEAQRLLNQAQTLGAVGDAAATVGMGVATGLAVKDAREEAKKEEREAEEKRIADLTEEAEIAFDEGMTSVAQRQTWTTPEMYDQFIDLEEGYRQEYIDLVKEGKKREAAELLRNQQTRASELNAIKGSMETAAGVHGGNGGGWSNKIKHDKNLQTDLGILSKMEPGNPSIEWDDGKEMVLTITAEDGRFEDDAAAEAAGYEKNEEGKYIKKYRKAEIDKIVADGIAPSELRTSSKESLNKVRDNAFAGNVREPNWDDRALDIAADMDEGDIETYFLDPIYHKSNTFVDDFMSDENPVWQGDPIPIKGNPDLEALDPNQPSDGKITEDEWSLLVKEPPTGTYKSLEEQQEATYKIMETRRLIANEMKNHPKIARKYLSEWIAGIEKQNWEDATQQGRDNRRGLAADKEGGNNMG